MRKLVPIITAVVTALIITTFAVAGPGLGIVKTAPIAGTGSSGEPLKLTLCAADEIYTVNAGGTAWECAAESAGAGDIEGVTAGAGLTGGGITGTVTLDVVGSSDFSVAANEIDLSVTVTAPGSLAVATTSALTGLVTATAGGTSPANWTTTGSGDLVSADDLTVADDSTIGNDATDIVTTTGQLSFVLADSGTDYGATNFAGGEWAMFGPNAANTGLANLGLSYSTANDEAQITSVNPSVGWKKMTFAGSDWAFKPTGATTNQVTISGAGLVTATGGVTTPANLTTTSTGDVVSADDVTAGDDLFVVDDSTIGNDATDVLAVTGAAIFGGTAEAAYIMFGANQDVHLRAGTAAGTVNLGNGGVNVGGVFIGHASNATTVVGDLAVGDDTAMTGDLAVTGTTTTGGLVGGTQTVATCGHDIALAADTTVLICTAGGVYGMAGGVDGRIVHVVAGTAITVDHEAGGSTAAYRLFLTASITPWYMYTNQVKTFVYDGVDSRWKAEGSFRFPQIYIDGTLDVLGAVQFGNATTDTVDIDGDLTVDDSTLLKGSTTTLGDGDDAIVSRGAIGFTGTDVSVASGNCTVAGEAQAFTITTNGDMTSCIVNLGRTVTGARCVWSAMTSGAAAFVATPGMYGSTGSSTQFTMTTVSGSLGTGNVINVMCFADYD